MAIANSRVVADVVEVSEFMDLAQRYMVRGVPKTVINDAAEFLGNVPEETFVEHIRRITPSM
jgi:predicted DsbA family dithiol-disulfide isomerase